MVKKSRISPIFKRAASHIFTKPATTKYPFVKPKLPDDFRGQTVYTIESCNVVDIGSGSPGLTLDVHSIVGSSCRVCARDCPAYAIEIVEVEGGKKRHKSTSTNAFSVTNALKAVPERQLKAQFSTS